MRILYVEDNLANVSLVRRVATGHEIINYIDGEDALNNFDTDKPDLILMDIQLAGRLNGLQVVKELREHGHQVPIIAVTAYAMVGDRERCLAAGCDGYIAKPLPIHKLLEIIKHYANTLTETETAKSNAEPALAYEDDIHQRDTKEIEAVNLAEKETQESHTLHEKSAPEKETTLTHTVQATNTNDQIESVNPEIAHVEAEDEGPIS